MKKKNKNKNIIPGFGGVFGVTVAMMSIIVLIPLCSLVIYSAKLSPGEFWEIVTNERVVASYKVSLLTAFIAAVINGVMGVILAWVLVRYDFPGKKILDGMIELPFALPTAVAGMTLTHLSIPEGWFGKFFGKFGIEVAYTRFGITLALIFVGIPFVVRNVQPVLEKMDLDYEEAADMMGASRSYTFLHVILPEITPSLIAGVTMAFARGIGEYGSVVFIAGNMPYKTEITPLLIMSELEQFNYSAATAIALVMLLISFGILLVNSIVQSRAMKILNG